MISIQEELIPPTSARRLRSRFRGALLRPGEEGYEEARRVWNGAIDRHPALIARCAGTDDVVEAVRFAREQDLLVSVRGGGHAVAGHAVCDGGVMIDLSLMKAVRVDPATSTARAPAGCCGGSWTPPPSRSGWPPPAASSATPASAASPSAAAWVN
jgi:hypothetical protein